MKKTLKSAKIDNDLLEIVDLYTSLMNSICGDAATFTKIVEEGIGLYLLQQVEMLRMLANSKITMQNGVLKKIAVTKEQQNKLHELEFRVLGYRAENEIGGIALGNGELE